MDYTPPPDVLCALANQNITTKLALCEWIDNSLDADARTVEIVFGKNRSSGDTFVAVKDNGSGCADLRPFGTLGRHSRHKTTVLGRFGIGSKDAALFFGGDSCVLIVDSIHAGVRRQITIDWGAMLKSGCWTGDDPILSTSGPGETGTRIRVEPVIRKVPEGRAWDELLQELGYIYTPAIKRGVQITIQSRARGSKPVPLVPWSLPALAAGHVDETIEVGGKRARVYAGIVRDGVPNHKPGLTYMHGFRVIRSACSKGCGHHSTSRVAGFVNLIGTWPLRKNKDDIQSADSLYEAVELSLKALLERAQRASMDLQSEAFTKQVEGLLSCHLNDSKARRGNGSNKGTRNPNGKGGRHRRADNEQSGERFPSKRRLGSLRIEWDTFGRKDDTARIAGSAVVLNLDNDFVAEVHKDQNVKAAMLLALEPIITSETCMNTRQLRLPIIEDDDVVKKFTRTMGALLGRKTIADGNNVLVDAAE